MSERRRVRPFVGPARGVAPVPGSKSQMNRALICAAVAEGTSVLDGVLFADDTEAMLAAIAALGANVHIDRPARRVEITGLAGPPQADGVVVDARLSGTTSRFVVPIAAAGQGRVRVDGLPPLRERPFGDLLTALRSLGAGITDLGQPGFLPVEVNGTGLDGGRVSIPASVSSQFTSGLLMAAPLLRSPLEVRLEGDIVSRPYLELTQAVMRSFGATIERIDATTFAVEPSGYRAAGVRIEPDASAASYFAAAAAITGGTVRIEGLDRSSLQGDTAFIDVLAEMGAAVSWEEGAVEITGGRLLGGTYDLRDFSDTAQTLAAVAVFADAPVEITGIGFIRAKETDRIGAMVTELRRCGAEVSELPDGLRIVPNVGRLHGAAVETYDDHRMAMSMTLLGLRVPGIDIVDPDCVAKTFPDFFDAIERIRPAMSGASSVTVVAIDGPAGAGKSTVAKLLAQELHLPHFDTGAMYRAVTAVALRAGTDLEDEAAVAAHARTMDLKIGERILLDGVDATAEIRLPQVNQTVSVVAAHPEVRRILVERQREWARELGGGVMEGRDIGTTVFPDAVLKAYLTARPDVRAQRRRDEGSTQTLEEITADIERRDRLDSTRSESPLQAAPGAIIVDTSDLTLAEVVEQLAVLFRSAVEAP